MIILDRLGKETGRDYAVRVIRKNIIQLELEPGALVSENEICTQLGLSRTPIREALMELAKVNIVEILPQKGSRVALIDYNLVEESRLMRLLLEVSCAETLCAVGLAQPQRNQMAENLALQKFCVENDMAERFFELDDEFHALLFQFANRTLSHQMAKNFCVHFDRVRNISLGSGRQHDESLVNEHQAMFNAIVAQDPVAAKEATIQHLTGYQVDAQSIRNKYPDYIIH